MTVNIYGRYFLAEGVFSGVARKGAAVWLIADSDAGNITYTVQVSFFPYKDPEDFGISYDACFSEVLYAAKGRRSKKREESLLADLQTHADALAAANGAKIFWEKPLL